MPLQLEIVTPEREAYSDVVDAVYCPPAQARSYIGRTFTKPAEPLTSKTF